MRLPHDKSKVSRVAQAKSKLSSTKFLTLAVVVALTLVTLAKTYESTQYTFLAYASDPSRSQTSDRSLPTFINIPSLLINLPVEEVANHSLFWKTGSDTASHVAQSGVPGESDNVVLYGRNTKENFGRLTSLQKGDLIVVTTLNGQSYDYEVTDLFIVSPTEVNFISTTDSETLTIYTSIGFANLKRFVVQAHPLKS